MQQATTLMQYNSQKGEWEYLADVGMRYADNHLELTIPRKLLKLAEDKFTLDFKWTDNPAELKDPISLCTDGDTAPNRRFNYRLIWNKE